MRKELLKLKPKQYLCPYCGNWHRWENPHSLDYFNANAPAELADPSKADSSIDAPLYLRECVRRRFTIWFDDKYFHITTDEICWQYHIQFDDDEEIPKEKLLIDDFEEIANEAKVVYKVFVRLSRPVRDVACVLCPFYMECKAEKSIAKSVDWKMLQFAFGFEFDRDEFNKIMGIQEEEEEEFEDDEQPSSENENVLEADEPEQHEPGNFTGKQEEEEEFEDDEQPSSENANVPEVDEPEQHEPENFTGQQEEEEEEFEDDEQPSSENENVLEADEPEQHEPENFTGQQEEEEEGLEDDEQPSSENANVPEVEAPEQQPEKINTRKVRKAIMDATNNRFNDNFEFGLNKDENIASTLMSVAVKCNNTWRLFDKEKKELIDVRNMRLGIFPIYIVPTNKLEEGDLIKDKGEYYFVIEVTDGSAQTMCAKTGEMQTIESSKNALGSNYYSKVINLSGYYLDIDDDLDIEKMAIISSMMLALTEDGSQNPSESMNQSLPLLLLKDNGSSDDEMIKLALMHSMMPTLTENDRQDSNASMKKLLPLLLFKDKNNGGGDMMKLALVAFAMSGNIAGCNLVMGYMMLNMLKRKEGKEPNSTENTE